MEFTLKNSITVAYSSCNFLNFFFILDLFYHIFNKKYKEKREKSLDLVDFSLKLVNSTKGGI